MRRSESGFVAAVVGALLVVCGAAAYPPPWVLTTAGVLVLLSGLLAWGHRGAVVLALAGGWLLLSRFLPWAVAAWNLMLGGLVVLALGFLVGAVGAAGAGD